jgi:transcriptional regulator with XRE-family HTH domain
MPRPKPTDADIKERKALAKTFKVFRRDFKITQRALADLMREPGDDSPAGCRRTIQMIESGKISPHKSTLTRFAIVKNRYESENA